MQSVIEKLKCDLCVDINIQSDNTELLFESIFNYDLCYLSKSEVSQLIEELKELHDKMEGE